MINYNEAIEIIKSEISNIYKSYNRILMEDEIQILSATL